MKTLCLDSAHRHLVIVLAEDGNICASFEQECWKRQSETIFPELIRCMEEAHWQSEDIDEVVITDGPGSYTGVRIAMSIAKVFCTTMHKPLSCISTLQLYAGMEKDALVMLDARSKRVYCARYHEGELIGEERICTLDEIRELVAKERSLSLFGDCALIDKRAEEISLSAHFVALLPKARSVANIHTLTPRYLKENDAYKVK